MSVMLYAQPYQIGVEGFYLSSANQFEKTLPTITDRYGEPVEEFELQFVEGDDLDAEFAKAWGLNQANVKRFFEVVEGWDEYAKINFIIAVGEAGYHFDYETVGSADFDVSIYFVDSLKDLAYEFVDEGLFGEIADNVLMYLDYDAIARDLSVDYTKITIANTQLVYRID